MLIDNLVSTNQGVSIAVLEKDLEKCVREKTEMKSELDKTVDHSQAQLNKSNDLFEQAQREVLEALKRQTIAEHEAGRFTSISIGATFWNFSEAI